MGEARLEAFSDGVLAVAITLLVLDLHATRASPLSLADQLREEWPTFAAYVVSFLVIGVIWLNHHSIFRVATAVDHRVQVYNLMLLMFVAAIPFSTATYAEYVREGGMDRRRPCSPTASSWRGWPSASRSFSAGCRRLD